MAQHISPYHAPNFYADSLAKGRHRDIVGGRWDETGRAQMALLLDEGLLPDHHLLDIGAGSLRLGCKAVPYLDPRPYCRPRFPALQKLLFTVFHAPDAASSLHPVKQPDGVVTHDTRAPYHMLAADVLHLTTASGFSADLRPNRLPRGQILLVATPN